MVVPKKGLPWLHYFFQFTWPALLLFLKSCGQKEKVAGKAFIEERKTGMPILTMGVALPQITPVDTGKLISTKRENRVCSTVVGDIEIQPSMTIGEIVVDKDTSLKDQGTSEKPDSDSLLGDTTVVATNLSNDLRSVVLGGFSVVRKAIRQKEVPLMPAQQTAKEQKSLQALVFPNPVQKGHPLTVTTEQPLDGNYHVFGMAGQLIKTGRIVLTEQQTFSIPIQNCPAGIYILRLTSNDGAKMFVQKIVVL
ncbi:MAG TPA: T9SS type A sorting domain-containing protein [Flavisolibacter sp.]|nr:T9SS type A sorting domain-containing protein [Flavisolibacter sp.]